MASKRCAPSYQGSIDKKPRTALDVVNTMQGTLSIKRIENHVKKIDEHFKKDGVISEEELVDYVERNLADCSVFGISSAKDARALFKESDHTGSGVVSCDEYCAALYARNVFEAADVDKNGQLSIMELSQFVRKNSLVEVRDEDGKMRSHESVAIEFMSVMTRSQSNSTLCCPRRRTSVDMATPLSQEEFCHIVASWKHSSILKERREEASEVLQTLLKHTRQLCKQPGVDFFNATSHQIGQELQLASLHHCFVKRQERYSCRLFGLCLRLAVERFVKMMLVYRGVNWTCFRNNAQVPELICLIDLCIAPRDVLEQQFRTGLVVREPCFRADDVSFLHKIRMMTNPCLHDTLPEDFTVRIPLSHAEQLLLLRYANCLAEKTLALLQRCQDENIPRIDPKLRCHHQWWRSPVFRSGVIVIAVLIVFLMRAYFHIT